MKQKYKQIIIDTDIGDDVDDAAAIMLALQSPEVEIVGITTVYQNTFRRAEMACELCSYYGKSGIPVHVGYGRSLIERIPYEEYPIQYPILEKQHKIDHQVTAVDFIINSVDENPDILIVGMGSMTNLAMAFCQAPEIMKQAKILAMGGVFNQNVPEWNIQCDPEAARIVMDFAQHLVMFGLEVTKYCSLLPEDLQMLEQKKDPRIDYFLHGVQLFRDKTGYSVILHDALLIAYLLDEKVVELKKSDYTVELSGQMTRGSMVIKENAYGTHTESEKEFYYATNIDAKRFKKLFLERIGGK